MITSRVLLLSFGLLSSSEMLAQAARVPTPRRFGFIAGINQSKFTDADGAENLAGFTIGSSMIFPFTDNLAIQSDLVYTTKGAETSSTSGSGALKMNYVELPLLLRFDIPATGGVKPLMYAGPAIAYQLTCDAEGRSGGVTLSMTCREFDTQFGSGTTVFNLVDAGLVVGGGLGFEVGRNRMTLGARYTAGFVTISEDSDSKHRVLSFLASFEWCLSC